jgi:PAS domain S-box-containing protein
MGKSDGDNTPSKNSPVSQTNQPFSEVDIVQVALNSAHVGIWIIDSASGTFLPSKHTKELFGFLSDEEMSLKAAMLQVSDKHRKRVSQAIEDAFEKKTRLYIEYPIVGLHDNKHRWLSVTGDFGDTVLSNGYFSGIVIDITERKQDDLRRSKFIGIVSHELKTPLTALKAYVQMLNAWASKQKDNFTMGALSKVDKQVRKMLNMINGLLNLSGAESGKIILNKKEFNLDELITEVIEETQFITGSHNIILVPCDVPRVNADRDKIEQVVVNLLSNAAKYSEKDTLIQIECTTKENSIEVRVKDKGLGIAPEDIKKLFLPHYRVASKETEKIEGFGIGLYLCSEIIKRHHGNIWVDSEPGKGSTFKFTLPVN